MTLRNAKRVSKGENLRGKLVEHLPQMRRKGWPENRLVPCEEKGKAKNKRRSEIAALSRRFALQSERAREGDNKEQQPRERKALASRLAFRLSTTTSTLLLSLAFGRTPYNAPHTLHIKQRVGLRKRQLHPSPPKN